MKAEEILKVVSVMRHDFLNHLQVISGYLQLDKKERAGEYIREVTWNLQRLSEVVHLKVPEIAAAFLLGEEMAAGVEARMQYNVQSDLNGCSVPGTVAGQAVYECLDQIFRFLDHENDNESMENSPRVMIDICDKGENCVCTLSFKAAPGYEAMNAALDTINEQLSKYGGQLNRAMDKESGMCTLEILLSKNFLTL